ncbi:uncharacterized protein K444DRAFT_630472 [Hyaloscypha bicolor E]|uniref:C2H2-type domain-containing protein n=1 Tax=Hyaloscypha bicolor E TaxID=1095630 RepID=A0A2J6T6Z6_9HELO|nr:uncharacterized protein K444DRAFT_630472 [Hyaloscypha bicolor E]PMD58790.1 hypothetical protein K444DRAFT_630472 [Hyaloscypha bicolor E]
MSVLKTALGSLGTTRKQPGMISQLQSSFDRYKCTWDECQQRLPGDKELRDHLSAHSVDALAHWACGSICTWQGCKFKAKFKTTHQFNTHLENIHAKPLLCTRSRCTYKRPFKNEYELERHNSSKHSAERPWECPYDYCPSETRAFARKDKWLKHIREVQHENDAFCLYHHCYFSTIRAGKGFEDRKEISTHFNLWHSGRAVDGYGCALGSCGNTGKRDRWHLLGLQQHLQIQHKIVLGLDSLQTGLKGTDHIFRSQQVPFDLYNKWIDCEICASQTLQTPLGNTTSTSAQFGMAPI